MTDFGFGDDGALRWSLAIICSIASVIGLACLMAHLPHYRARVEEAESWGRAAASS